MLAYQVVLLPLVPIPLVNLAFLQAQVARKLLNCGLIPVGIFVIHNLKEGELVSVFALSFALFLLLAGRVVPDDFGRAGFQSDLLLAEEGTHALIQVIRAHIVS